MGRPIPYRAGGSIHPSRFVKFGTTDNTVVEAGAGDLPMGISAEYVDRPPYDGLDTGLAAQSGEMVLVYQLGDVCWLETGAAVTTERRLKPSTNGVGIPVAADGDKYGAEAAQTAAGSGSLIQVKVVLGERAS